MVTNTNNFIRAQGANNGLKSYIIGRLWLSSKDGTRPGVLRISRDLPKDVVLSAGSTLFLNFNKKRPGKMDPDYSVSCLLPTDTANQLISAQKQMFPVQPKESVAAFTVD